MGCSTLHDGTLGAQAHTRRESGAGGMDARECRRISLIPCAVTGWHGRCFVIATMILSLPQRPAPDERGLHLRLAEFQAERLRLLGSRLSPDEQRLRTALEHDFLERCREHARLPDGIDMGMEALGGWMQGLDASAGQSGVELLTWITEAAAAEAIAWYVRQDLLSEADLQDLLAQVMVALDDRARTAIASIIWDECGHGEAAGNTAINLARLRRKVDSGREGLGGAELARANLMRGLAGNRPYILQALGAIDATFAQLPRRAAAAVAGLTRIGTPLADLAGLRRRVIAADRCLLAWRHEVIVPLASESTVAAGAIAEGMAMRAAADARCLEFCTGHLLTGKDVEKAEAAESQVEMAS